MSYLNDPKNQLFNKSTDPGLTIRKNRRRNQNQTSYNNQAFDPDLQFKMEQEDLKNKVELVNEITSADKAKAVLKNKYLWIFIGIVILIIIFFILVYLVPSVHNLVCHSIEGADACTQLCGDCANDADCCAKSGKL